MKPCQGIVIAPIKAHMMVNTEKSYLPVNRYTPPSKRKEEPKTLTKEEINSDAVFPSLAPMKPMTSGASWAQLRNRLSRPANPFQVLAEDENPSIPKPDMNFMRVIDERLKREGLEKEEGIKREAITEPRQMSMDQREANGWSTLRLPPNLREMSERLAVNPPLNEKDYYDSGHAFESRWLPGMPVECVHLGGTPIERTEKRVDHFTEYSINNTPTVVYSPISESSVAAAKAKFSAFFRKSEKYAH